LVIFPYRVYRQCIVGIYVSLAFEDAVKFEVDVWVCKKFAKM